MSENKLIIFVKAPRPGLVKTRLAAAIGLSNAANAYRVLVEGLLGQLAKLPEVELRFSPDNAFSEIQSWLEKSWDARPQGSGDLGRRLHSAFADAFAAGAKRVVIIGSDCPDVSQDDIQTAWAALLTSDVVLGPATDGGYWLIGLRQIEPALFHEMAWSVPTVLEDTLGRAASAQLCVQVLRRLTDIDTEADWSAYLAASRKI